MEERKCVGWQEQETSRLFSAVQEARGSGAPLRSEEHTSELQSHA